MMQRDKIGACPWSGLLIHPGGDSDIGSGGFPVMGVGYCLHLDPGVTPWGPICKKRDDSTHL